MKSLDEAILTLVAGDLTCLDMVLNAEHQHLLAATHRLPKLALSREALKRVLLGWRDGAWGPEEVQRWSSFIRRGYVVGNFVTGHPTLQIDYEEQDEEEIVEVQARLDQIGDWIDGRIDGSELEAMIRCLLAVRPDS